MNKLVFRSKLPERNSIENLFNQLLPYLKENQFDKIELPKPDASFWSIIQNIKFLRRNQGEINHITGDVNYVIPFISRPILTIHDIGSALNHPLWKRTIIKLFWLILPGLYSKRITVISAASRDEVLKVIPFVRKKIKVIHNPVPPCFKFKAYVFNDDKPKIFLLGTKSNKNLERTIEALSKIHCHLMILGKLTKSQRALLDQYSFEYDQEGINEEKSFENHFDVSLEEVVALYEKSDIVGFVSTYEGFGMPMIEAQAVGRPVIGGHIESIREVVELSAVLVDPYKIHEITDAFNRVINDEDFRKDLIQRGTKNTERFKIERIADQYMQVYRDVLNEA